jgi:hypothetical protein
MAQTALGTSTTEFPQRKKRKMRATTASIQPKNRGKCACDRPIDNFWH